MDQEHDEGVNPPDINSLITQLGSATNEETYLKQVYEIFEIYELAHGCLLNSEADGQFSDALWRKAPKDISEICASLINAGKHPAIQLGKNRQFPFDLFDFRNTVFHDPDIEALYASFSDNGIEHAYGIPIQTQNNETYVFVVARPGPPLETVELLALQTICANAVQRVQQFNPRPCDANRTKKLSDQERHILMSIAKGTSRLRLSKIMGISMDEFDSLTNNILSKFKANNVSHAIVLALIEGEFGLTAFKKGN